MKTPDWLSSTAALTLLRVRPQTLYANVSRRRIRVKPDPHDPRRRQCALGSVTSITIAGDEVTSVRYSEPSGSGRRGVGGA